MDNNSKRICLDKIKEKDNIIEFQKIILDISCDFLTIEEENFNKKVEKLLERLVVFLKVDRAYIFTVNYHNKTIRYSAGYLNKDLKDKIERVEELYLENFSWWLNQLNENKSICIDDVKDMPDEAAIEKEQLYKKGIKSLISIPIFRGGRFQAFLGVDSLRSIKKWTKQDVQLIDFAATILSHGADYINHLKKIDFISYHDGLTGLANHLLLADRVNEGILLAHEEKNFVSIMFLNLDDFKTINDSLGHNQGDELLKQVSKRLLSLVRKNDTVSRRSGDEFIIYINDYGNERNLDIIGSKIINSFKDPFILKDKKVFITASMGISRYPVDGEDLESLIKNADIAMYKAKSLGKNQYQKCTEELKNEVHESILLSNDLNKAIDEDEMVLYYQPQVVGSTGEIIGVEALIRWKHLKHDFIPPSKFIPLAEETGAILPIGYWVLKTACEQGKEWQDKGLKSIKTAVNFSIHQLNQPDILEQIEEILANTCLEANSLEIEITESAEMDNIFQTKKTLEDIKKMGFTLAIDDYGKGYSSLTRLKESPFDKIKIDMSFVHGIGINLKDETIIKSLVEFASMLGLEAIAEGVETKEQVDFLNEIKCHQMQGYYFYKPMPAVEIEKLLAVGVN